MARANLADELAKPSFTPGRADAPALVELVIAGDERAPAALAKLSVARDAIAARLNEGDEAGRARLVQALGLLARAGDLEARGMLVTHVGDSQVRVRRAAIVALGKLTGDVVARDALVVRWDAADVTPDERRALTEALGKLGGEVVETRLKAMDAGEDAELARRRDRALLMIARDAKRPDESDIATDMAPLAPLAIRLHCREGLAGMLADELRALAKPERVAHFEGDRDHPGAAFTRIRAGNEAFVDVEMNAPWRQLFASRLWTYAGIRVPLKSETVDAITDAIVAAEPMMAAWTVGPVRWRLGFASGHRRAVVWNVAKAVTARAPRLINDPTQTAWDILVDDGGYLELVPRRARDPRFAYRVADVPAASHPTVAAALARVAALQPGDRAWDPFCGSGLELIECAQSGATVMGSDIDDEALDAARKNILAWGRPIEVVNADARTHAVTCNAIVTNPPLGSRVQLDAVSLLVGCLPHFAAQLPPGGRLVWITPATKATTPAAEAAGLQRTLRLPLDLGGVRGTLERWVKP